MATRSRIPANWDTDVRFNTIQVKETVVANELVGKSLRVEKLLIHGSPNDVEPIVLSYESIKALVDLARDYAKQKMVHESTPPTPSAPPVARVDNHVILINDCSEESEGVPPPPYSEA
jgi:hypothetical protein